jgi:hypothetical protein
MTERELQDAIVELAQLFNWMVMHQRPARTVDGWRTAIQGHPGFPDLVMVRNQRLIFAELKSAKREPDANQSLWLNRVRVVPGVEKYVWRPADWELGTIEDVLR